MSEEHQAGYETAFLPYKTTQGEDRLGFVVKRTLDVRLEDGRAVPSEEQEPILTEDEFYDGGDMSTASVRVEGELSPPKERVDLVVRGTARAPNDEPVPTFDVSLTVGDLVRTLRIVGDRRAQWVPPRKVNKKDPTKTVHSIPTFSEPEPIAELPLRYEYAYGGRSYVVPLFPEAMEAAREKRAADVEAARKKQEEAEAAQAAAQAAEAERAHRQAVEAAALAGEALPEAPSALDGAGAADEAGPAGTQILDVSELEAAATTGEGGAIYDAPPDAERAVSGGEYRLADRGDIKVVADFDEGRQAGASADAAPGQAADDAPPFDPVQCVTNPVGRGFALGSFPETIDELPLPNIESPSAPLTPEALVVPQDDPMAVSVPAGWGWYARGWYPRAIYLGADEDTAQKAQDKIDEMLLELDPEDADDREKIEALLDMTVPIMDPRALQGAHPDLILDTLRGDEEVRLTNMDESGVYFFRLPGLLPVVTFDRGDGPEFVDVRLDTLVIDTDEHRCVLIWRGALPYGGLEELAGYTRLDVAARDTLEDERRAIEAQRTQGEHGTELLDLAAVEQELKATAGDGAGDEAADDSDYYDVDDLPVGEWVAERDARGDRVLRDQDNVVVEDAWVAQELKEKGDAVGQGHEDAERSAQEAKAAAKEALRARLAQIKAEEAAKKKKKK